MGGKQVNDRGARAAERCFSRLRGGTKLASEATHLDDLGEEVQASRITRESRRRWGDSGK
jgi:hypothetical protein